MNDIELWKSENQLLAESEAYEIYLIFLDILWNKRFLDDLFSDKSLWKLNNNLSNLIWNYRYNQRVKNIKELSSETSELKNTFLKLFETYRKEFENIQADWIYWNNWMEKRDQLTDELFELYRGWLNTFEKISKILNLNQINDFSQIRWLDGFTIDRLLRGWVAPEDIFENFEK